MRYLSSHAMRWLVTLIAGLHVTTAWANEAANPARLAISPADTERAKQFLNQLGNPNYKVREQAYRELMKMGRLAVKALEQGRLSQDTEVRLRCETLLPIAEAAELKARVDAFLADGKGEYDHDLAGWVKFRLIAGDSATTRDLFGAVISRPQNHAILLAMKEIPQRLVPPLSAITGGIAWTHPELPQPSTFAIALENHRAAIYAEHMKQLPNGGIRQKVPAVPDHALLLLAESQISERETRFNPISYQTMNWLYQQQLRDAALGKSEYKDSYRLLVINWINSRDGLQSLSNAINVAQFLQLGTPTIGRIAGKLLTLDGNQPWTKANALTLIARHKAVDEYYLVKQCFSDDTTVVKGGPGNPMPDILVQDVALAMAIAMTGQQAKDYGFELQHSQEAMRYNYTNYRFRDDDDITAEQKRKAAFEKWYQWEATQLGGVISPGLAHLVVTPKKK